MSDSDEAARQAAQPWYVRHRVKIGAGAAAVVLFLLAVSIMSARGV